MCIHAYKIIGNLRNVYILSVLLSTFNWLKDLAYVETYLIFVKQRINVEKRHRFLKFIFNWIINLQVFFNDVLNLLLHIYFCFALLCKLRLSSHLVESQLHWLIMLNIYLRKKKRHTKTASSSQLPKRPLEGFYY